MSALTVDYLYKDARSRPLERLVVKAFLYPNHVGVKLSIHIAILYTCVSAQDPSSRSCWL